MASLTDRFKYDVFLSFRGEDTRHGFTGYLKKALDEKGVRTFIDDEDLQKGNEITPSLFDAIDVSMMAIVVLSENYASSSFCLQELSKILDTMKDKVGRFVLPVFYKVDPSDVRKLKRSYGEAMDKHEEASSSSHNMNNKWKNSLRQVASLAGHHYKGDGYEHEFIEKIVEQVLRNIKPIILPVGDYQVGLEHQRQHVTSLLNVGSDDTIHMVGIHGIGGIGKTTLAREVYNSIVSQFQCSCYLEKVRENFDKKGLINLQKILLSQIVGEKNTEITSVGQGISILRKRLPKKKILLLLDDVDNEEQLKAIAGSSDWFGPGSRVIITTRDNRLLTCHGVKKTYEVKGLNDEDAFDLVGWKALKNDYNQIYKDVLLEEKHERELNLDELRRLKDLKKDNDILGFANVLKRAVAYASGLPLALEVIGSHFFNKTTQQCEDALSRYERVPHNTIQTTLELSYEALQVEEKTVFLDIACCFKGYELAKVEQILHAHHGDIMKDHIIVLAEKSLLKINEYGNVTLHDLIEDMGKEIVRRESPEDPGKRSRLWSSDDIIKVLQENTGTRKIEIIHLNRSIRVEWDGEAFKRMKNLKTLIFSTDVSFSENPKHLPNGLRVLECNGISNPFEWQGFLTKKFQNMRVLNLDDIGSLREIPDISSLPNLEELSIHCCYNIFTIDKSIGFLRKLKILRIEYCPYIQSVPPLRLASLEELHISGCGLNNFPPVVDGFGDKLKTMSVRSCTNLRSIPPLKLDSLETLDLSCCYSLESFPLVIDGFVGKLKTLLVTTCSALRSIPPLKWDSLETLELSNCPRLESFPLVVDGHFGKLKTLLVTHWHSLRSIPPLKLDSLETLELLGCYNLESFPLVVDGYLGKLKTMRVESCDNLKSIPPLKLDSLEKLDISYCDRLERFPLVVDGFLGKLKTLVVMRCRNLKSIPPLKLGSLEKLDISYCDSLESFPLVVDGFLGKLKTLVVIHCRNLKSIPPLKLDSLEKLDISYCDSLESFPLVVDGFLGKLRKLRVSSCRNLRSIPPLWLTSLESLNLSYCPSLESFPKILGEMRNVTELYLDKRMAVSISKPYST